MYQENICFCVLFLLYSIPSSGLVKIGVRGEVSIGKETADFVQLLLDFLKKKTNAFNVVSSGSNTTVQLVPNLRPSLAVLKDSNVNLPIFGSQEIGKWITAHNKYAYAESPHGHVFGQHHGNDYGYNTVDVRRV